MFKDPIVEEVRKIRLEIEQECGGTSEAYSAHLERIQEQWKDRLVNRGPKEIPKVKLAS